MTIKKYYILPIFAIGLFLITFVINEFRYELFGIRPGYAPHNFGFNMLFFLPSTVISLICALIVLIRKSKQEIPKAKFYSILIVVPILIMWIWQIVRKILVMG